ncbi:hypothetical protein CCZ01_04715 [Helicobacter monodelphidis]|nr:hypothetical protein CCZ01_04715 [Helicobacter sp. 15-1451]
MNHDIFGQVGVGVRLAMTEWVHLKAEGRYMAVLDGRQDAIASLGVAIPFGKATFSNTAQRSQTSRSAESRQQVAKEDINQQNPQTQSSPTQTAGATTQPSESLEEGTTMAADRQMAKNTEGVDNQPSGVGHSDGSQGATAGVAAGTTAGAVAGERLAYAGIPGQKQVGEGFMMSDGNGGVSSAKNTPVIETEHGKFTPTKTVTLNMNDVRFQFDSFSVPTRFDKDIQEFAGELKQKPSARALLEGHTDYIGTEAYNQKLSVNRANAVKSRLIHFGADRSKIDVKGFGKSRPIADNATDEGRAQNRRVEMILIEPVQ